ncbi:MAG: tRNA lysidine(34) synthetase TilS [Candidatus Glassbacteria bacterium]
MPGTELENKVRSFIELHRMIEAGDRVLAAVSGGVDSMVLLQVLNRLRKGVGFELAAAYFDHGLRAGQGRQESRFVCRVSAGLGVEFTGGRAEDLMERAQAGENLQEAARTQRYAFLRRAAEGFGCNRIATGHQRDDQAETVLLRLKSGSGFVGLAGIRPVSRSGSLIRPLLCVTRAEIEGFAGENGTVWIEDPTNATDKYFRNRLRHGLIPEVVRRYDPQFGENLAGLAAEAAELVDLLDRQADRLAAGSVEPSSSREVRLDCQTLQQAPGIIRRQILRRIAAELTDGGIELSGRPLIALDNLVNLGRSGTRISLPGNLTALKEFDRVTLGPGRRSGTSRAESGIELGLESVTRVEMPGASWEIEVSEEAGGWPAGLPPAGNDGARALEQRFDADRIALPLCATGWRPGDRFRPYGLDGEKKLKKIFGEKRVALGSRNSTPVIRDAAGTILWICGVSRSDRAPLAPSTRRIIRLRAARVASGLEPPATEGIIDTQIV